MNEVQPGTAALTRERLRILFLCEQYPPVVWDGVGSYTHDIAHALAELGHEVHIVCAQGFRVVDEVHSGVHVHRRPLFRLPVSRFLGPLRPWVAGRDYPRDSIMLRVALTLSYAFWLQRLNLKPDVVETQEGETRALSIALRHDVPLVVHLHTPTMLDLRMRDGELRMIGRLADRLDQISARHADALTCPSELLAQTLREYHWLPPTGCEVQVIPYPFDGSSLATLPPPTDTRPIVMTVGRVEWRKGPDVLIDAAGLLVQRGLPIELLFCGAFAGSSEGLPIEVWLKKRAASLGVTCRFTGHIGREQLLEHYASARVVAVPSRFESFSIAAFEGMAAGRPLVATSSIGAAPFIDRWQSGSVVPANDAPALADALAPFLIDANHATATGARGRTGTATHDSAHIATLRERVYRRAIEAHKLRRASAVRGDVVSAER